MAKRRKLQQKQNSRAQPKPKLKLGAPSSSRNDGSKNKPQPKKRHQQQHRQHDKPVIPFEPEDRMLLIGEADLSFAASIIEHHRCVNVTATVLEKDHAELVAKYPAVDDNIAVVLGTKKDVGGNAKIAKSSGESTDEQEGQEAEAANEAAGSDVDEGENEDEDEDGDPNSNTKKNRPANNKIIYNVDATKLPSSITRQPYTTILFNFPHVGGKSTDVNRQVRYNQELLVSFFRGALRALAPHGSIVVTLFEGEPYTLWNIRDLGRHAGLHVETSFRFQAAAYPGYKHARTLGVVRNKKGEMGGGWKGEDRAARSYVFRRKDEVKPPQGSKKRRRNDDNDDDDDDDDDESSDEN